MSKERRLLGLNGPEKGGESSSQAETKCVAKAFLFQRHRPLEGLTEQGHNVPYHYCPQAPAQRREPPPSRGLPLRRGAGGSQPEKGDRGAGRDYSAGCRSREASRGVEGGSKPLQGRAGFAADHHQNWQIKGLAIVQSSFREVLYLDSGGLHRRRLLLRS